MSTQHHFSRRQFLTVSAAAATLALVPGFSASAGKFKGRIRKAMIVGPVTEAALAPFKRGMALERAFVAAGGLLTAGCDPTGNGGTIPGISDWREVELLVEAGFTPVEAIRIATHNGAVFLGRQDRIGAVAPGMNADLVVIRGNPATRIEDLEKVETVFKDGVGFDSARLFESVRGRYGQY